MKAWNETLTPSTRILNVQRRALWLRLNNEHQPSYVESVRIIRRIKTLSDQIDLCNKNKKRRG